MIKTKIESDLWTHFHCQEWTPTSLFTQRNYIIHSYRTQIYASLVARDYDSQTLVKKMLPGLQHAGQKWQYIGQIRVCILCVAMSGMVCVYDNV